MKNVSSALAYGLYGTFALLSLLFVLEFIGETKGSSCGDMHGRVRSSQAS